MEVKEVTFDVDGMAENCPQDTIKTYGECQVCWNFVKAVNHTVLCSYQDKKETDE